MNRILWWFRCAPFDKNNDGENDGDRLFITTLAVVVATHINHPSRARPAS